MRTAEAVALHAAFRQAGGGEIVQAVIALHAPMPIAYSNFAECAGCNPGLYAESGTDWPECETLKVINQYLHVEGYPS